MSTLKPYRIDQVEGGRRQGSEAIFNSSFIHDIGAELRKWSSQRVLLVFSKALNANTTLVKDLEASLGPLLVDKKDGVGAHSPYRDVIDIAHKITQGKIDCVISLGSGSYTDACKNARLLQASLPPGFDAADVESLIDQETGLNRPGAIKKSTVKLIVVPTSLSAGEWNFAGSSTNESGKKQHFALDDGCAPDLVLADPKVASTAPEQLWLSSGMRAVDHCVETLCNRQCDLHPDAQDWCDDALRSLVVGLTKYKEGKDLGHRDELLEGISKCQEGSRKAIMGLVVYRIPMGASHAIGHQLGGVAGVMHGVTSCIMLPPVLRYTKDANPPAQARVLRAFNEALGWQEVDAGNAVARLVKELGLPSTLKDVGVTSRQQIDTIVDRAMTDVWGASKRQLEKAEILQIVEAAR